MSTLTTPWSRFRLCSLVGQARPNWVAAAGLLALGLLLALAPLEMTLAQIAYRTVQIDKSMTHKTKQERILIADQALTLSEIY